MLNALDLCFDGFAELGVKFELLLLVVLDEEGNLLWVGVGLIGEDAVDNPVSLLVHCSLILEFI